MNQHQCRRIVSSVILCVFGILLLGDALHVVSSFQSTVGSSRSTVQQGQGLISIYRPPWTCECRRSSGRTPVYLALSPSGGDNAIVAALTNSMTSVTNSPMAMDLLVYLLKSIINVAVPSIAIVTVAAIILSKRSPDDEFMRRGRGGRGRGFMRRQQGRKGGEDMDYSTLNSAEELYDDLYGDIDADPSLDDGPKSFLQKLLSMKPKSDTKKSKMINLGIPSQQYIRVKRLNDVYTSYQFSMDEATKSRAYAASVVRQVNFQRALGKAMQSLPQLSTAISPNDQRDLIQLEKEFLKHASDTLAKIQQLQTLLTSKAVERAMYEMDVDIGELDPDLSVAQLEPAKEDQDTTIEKNVTDTTTVTANITHTSSKGHLTTSASKIKHKFTELVERIPMVEKIMVEDAQLEMEVERLYRKLADQTIELAKLEQEFITGAVEILGPGRANGLRVAFLGNAKSPHGEHPGAIVRSLQDRPLSTILNDYTAPYLLHEEQPSSSSSSYVSQPIRTTPHRRRVFVTNFPGDVTASQVEELREEVTAIVQQVAGTNPYNMNSQPDEAVVILQSGGGTVTGYGLAAAQLRRFKAAGMKLTICVEQVAASGGYMMCCVADRIVASPFAVLGSIGVISEMPNVYERLKKEGIEFQTITAGKYKRTLTPTKKVTKEDLDKSKTEIEDVLTLFKKFVKANRPQLDIDSVATGETWFGEDALQRQLCDEIKTKDELLLEYVHQGCDVFEVTYEPDALESGRVLLPFGAASGASRRNDSSWLRRSIRWALRNVGEELKNEFREVLTSLSTNTNTDGVAQQYKAMDPKDTVNRVRASSTTAASSDALSDIEKLF
jgi:serine protease SohB